ncbi:MAG: hypothetical protein ACOYBE_03535 [Blautia sp.]|jgi:hypothetical protein
MSIIIGTLQKEFAGYTTRRNYSDSDTSPMIKDGKQVHVITDDDVNRVFAPCQTYFGYSSNKINARIDVPVFYLLQEDYTIPC